MLVRLQNVVVVLYRELVKIVIGFRIQWDMKLIAIKFSSTLAAEKADREFYKNLTPEQRLEIFFALHAQAHADENDANSQRMARVYRITQFK